MTIVGKLQQIIEAEEIETVGSAFGATTSAGRTSYSVASIRNAILTEIPFDGSSPTERALRRAHNMFPGPDFSILVACLVRFSFLIELTNITVGSTKMKTRWLPGQILVAQDDSFEPKRGVFQPGNDPRAATFDTCLLVFVKACNIVCDNISQDSSAKTVLRSLNRLRRVPYEFPLSYLDAHRTPIHLPTNISWINNDDLRWLLKARSILRTSKGGIATVLRKIEKSKLEVKLFKTDRSLTGRDKTNRAKRWEVLAGDFQHSSLEQCWSAERKLTADLVNFRDFPMALRAEFVRQKLIDQSSPTTLCPVTLAPLSFHDLARGSWEYIDRRIRLSSRPPYTAEAVR